MKTLPFLLLMLTTAMATEPGTRPAVAALPRPPSQASEFVDVASTLAAGVVGFVGGVTLLLAESCMARAWARAEGKTSFKAKRSKGFFFFFFWLFSLFTLVSWSVVAPVVPAAFVAFGAAACAVVVACALVVVVLAVAVAVAACAARPARGAAVSARAPPLVYMLLFCTFFSCVTASGGGGLPGGVNPAVAAAAAVGTVAAGAALAAGVGCAIQRFKYVLKNRKPTALGATPLSYLDSAALRAAGATKKLAGLVEKFNSDNFVALFLAMPYAWAASGVRFTGANGQMSMFKGALIDIYDPQVGTLEHEYVPGSGKVAFLVSRGAAADAMRQVLARGHGFIVLHGWLPSKQQLTLVCDPLDPLRKIHTDSAGHRKRGLPIFTLGMWTLPWAFPDLANVHYMRQIEIDWVAANRSMLDFRKSGLASINRCTHDNCRLARGPVPLISEAQTGAVLRLFHVVGLASANDLPTIEHAYDVVIRPHDKSYSANVFTYHDYTYDDTTKKGFFEHAGMNTCDNVHIVPIKEEDWARLGIVGDENDKHVTHVAVVLKAPGVGVLADDLEKHLQGGGA